MKNLVLLFITFFIIPDINIAQLTNKICKIPNAGTNEFSLFTEGVDTAWVRHYASGLEYNDDRVVDMVVDDVGNIYIVGHSEGWIGYAHASFLIIKYNPNGDEEWIARYGGTGGYNEYPTAITIDEMGNVYVTGTSRTFHSATIKYNSYGIEQWIVEQGGVDIAVDESGNVYLIDCVDGDYATFKYNSSGDLQWEVSYNGMQDWDDFPVELALDDSANVYVTGCIGYHGGHSSSWSEGIGTVKYNTSGILQWAVHYTEPSEDYDHIAIGIALDELGNIYVAGSNDRPGTGYDYVTIKYNNSGTEQWSVTYNSSYDDAASKLVVNSLGYIYVTGNSGTVKYNSSGVEQWIITDTGIDMVVDQIGNFYLLEEIDDNYALSKYNLDGILQWTASYNGPANAEDQPVALKLDNAENVIITGTSDGGISELDFATIKYNSSGAEQWVARYLKIGYSWDTPWAMEIDEYGNVYVTGSSQGHEWDYATIKYSNSGVEEWTARYNGLGDSYDSAYDIAVDDEGNVYITGESGGSSSKSDYATIKYNSLGEEQWVARYNGPGNDTDEAYALAIDRYGNVFVTGRSWGVNQSSSIAVVKYNSSGTEEWVARYGDGTGYAILVDDSEYVYVTGGSDDGYTTIKYDSSGAEQWVATYKGPGSIDCAIDIAVDIKGNVYVTGVSWGLVTQADYATIKYNSSGEEQWVKRYNGPGNNDEYPSALVIDNAGDIIVAGCSDIGTSTDFVIIKYDAEGVEKWIAYYGSVWYDELTAIDIDTADNIYVTGYCEGYTTLKYNPSGELKWVANYHRLGSTYNFPKDVAVSNTGDVYVTGFSIDGTGTYFKFCNYTTIKYVQIPVSVEGEQVGIPNSYGVSQNYPNPFNPTTTIKYRIPELSFVTIKIYDVLGNEIVTLVNSEKSTGNYEIEFNASRISSGIYFYRLQAGSFVETKKMILLK